MKDRLQWAVILGVCSLILAIVMQGPQWRHQRSPLAKGVAVSLNSDEAIYLARVQESLSGRPEQTAEAFTGHPNLVGTQFAMIERLYGTLFRFTGWRAAQVLTFLDVVVPIAVFVTLVFFFQLLGFGRKTALIAAAVFCILQLYNLNRPIHMRSSFLVMLWSLNFLLLAIKRSWWWGLLSGVLLGLLVGVYVWSFAFAWAFWGIYFGWEFAEWAYGVWQKGHKKTSFLAKLASKTKEALWFMRPRKPSKLLQSWHILLFTGLVGFLSAVPFILRYLDLQYHPLYDYGAFRSGMYPSHLPESWPYSGIFFIAVCTAVLAHVKQYEKLRPYRAVFVLLAAAFVYMNQQVVHGITFNFVSHGIFSLAIAAIAATTVAVVTRQKYLLVGAAALCVYLAAIGYDGRWVMNQWRVDESNFSTQHLASALPVLDDLPRGRFVSDPDTLAFIAGSTHHDVVYSVYLKNVLMTHREIALRYCLTQLPLRPEQRNIRGTQHLIMPDAVSALKGDTRIQEVALVESACAELDLDPALALQTFEVNYVFWNKKSHPNWNLRRLRASLVEVESGEDWILYRIDQ